GRDGDDRRHPAQRRVELAHRLAEGQAHHRVEAHADVLVQEGRFISAMRLALAALLLGCAATAAAQLYRWTDDKGKVHFGDTPPPAGARNVQKKAVGPASS